MKTRTAKAKGRAFENSIVAYLTRAGWPYTERRRLAGSRDKGDISGIPAIMIEAKAAKSYDLPGWMREVDEQTGHAKASIGVLWMKLVGKSMATAGLVVMRPHTFVRLLREAGYGPPWPADDSVAERVRLDSVDPGGVGFEMSEGDKGRP